jgi:hypothetical protein
VVLEKGSSDFTNFELYREEKNNTPAHRHCLLLSREEERMLFSSGTGVFSPMKEDQTKVDPNRPRLPNQPHLIHS